MTDLTDCLLGKISPQVALARMLLGGADSVAIAGAVAAARTEPPTPRWCALSALLDGRAADLDRLATEIRQTGSDHTAIGGLAGTAAFFDRAVNHSPEAGVALYSLGDPAILQAATAEITAWLGAEHLLRPDSDVLDFGCGIGRVAAALAPVCHSVLGVDVSAGMVAEARRRHAGRPGLRFEVTDGRAIPPGRFDLVLLVDSMPYVVQAGLADGIVAGVVAALRAGGALAILNLSYGRDPAMDVADMRRWASDYDLEATASEPFQLWDGRAFLLRSRSPVR
jgi:SAM-dependent methyltransferase